MALARAITAEMLDGVADRFWQKVRIAGPSECWVWVANRAPRGYGRFSINSEYWPAHRIAASLQGRIPETWQEVCHHCDNPPCCNPDHLFLGTTADNAEDRRSKGREPDRRGEGNGRARLTAENVREIRASPKGPVHFVKKFNVSSRTVRDARSGRTWSHLK